MPITQCDVSPAAVRENGGFLGKSFRTGREIRRFAARTGNAWGSQGQRPDSFDYTICTDFRGNAPVNCLAQPNGLDSWTKTLIRGPLARPFVRVAGANDRAVDPPRAIGFNHPARWAGLGKRRSLRPKRDTIGIGDTAL